ncbi:hypothetical protein HS041_15845 [Planomonospora sp. ID67723]|uniref:hypothetical protein n=1 Tax=Planomonospora sp. ID67723 TaxID=2738134 RepID=UPI0018C437A5|nr:hypothetical protein [Planomonospora sp. ID67723]MBG0829241.1 hypothetical protein [Planomonospora sp. ID67723]
MNPRADRFILMAFHRISSYHPTGPASPFRRRRHRKSRDRLESLRNAAWAEAFILVPTLVAGVLACMIVLRISGFQEARRAGHGPYNPYDARFTAPVG